MRFWISHQQEICQVFLRCFKMEEIVCKVRKKCCVGFNADTFWSINLVNYCAFTHYIHSISLGGQMGRICRRKKECQCGVEGLKIKWDTLEVFYASLVNGKKHITFIHLASILHPKNVFLDLLLGGILDDSTAIEIIKKFHVFWLGWNFLNLLHFTLKFRIQGDMWN